MNLKLKKGVSLNIAGAVPQGKTTPSVVKATECAIVPDDFEGFVPKLAVKAGDAVAVGTPLLYEKNHPEMKLVAPLAGRVRAVVRGDRRKIMRVVVEADSSADASAPVWP